VPESRVAIVFITEISNHNLTTLVPKLKMAICSLQLADFAQAFWGTATQNLEYVFRSHTEANQRVKTHFSSVYLYVKSKFLKVFFKLLFDAFPVFVHW
jgi:hypothetical protein